MRSPRGPASPPAPVAAASSPSGSAAARSGTCTAPSPLHAAHFSFPKALWADIFEMGQVTYHPVCPGKPGPAARRIEDDADVRDVIELMRLNYHRLLSRQAPAAA